MVETVGMRIRHVRASLSQAAFSARLGINISLLGKYERDQSVPGGDFLSHFHKTTGVDLNWLLTGVGEPYPQPSLLLDNRLMGLVLEGIKATYAAEHARLDDRSAGELAAQIYADVLEICDGSDDPEDRRAALRLALSRLRRNLASTDPEVQRKHQD